MSDVRWDDPREYGERDREDGRPRVYDERDRDDHDPRDGLMHDLDLPRGEERELVVDRDRAYELNGEDSRTLAAVGAFRVVPAQDLDIDHETLDHLRDEGLVDVVDLGDDKRGATLTKDGRDLLDSHEMDRGDEPWHPDNRNRRRQSIGRMVERVMILDAVLSDRRCWWLSSEADKRTFFDVTQETGLRPEEYPHITFRSGSRKTVRCFPDKLPIGIDKEDTSRFVFLYLVNRRIPVDFRQFLIRHHNLLPRSRFLAPTPRTRVVDQRCRRQTNG
jgi:hypothetical protein